MEEKRLKYTIADVQQDRLLELGLDLKDAFILSYLRELASSENIIDMNMEGKRYIWLDYDSLISYLPVLKINNLEVIGRRFKKYTNLGLIKKHLHKTLKYGTYTFFHLEPNFSSLFEIKKIDKTDLEREEIIKKMGLPVKSTQKSGGFDSKVDSLSTQKSVHNTPTNILQVKDSSSREKLPASNISFEKELKELLATYEIKEVNQNSIRNLKKYSNKDLNLIKQSLEYMITMNKSLEISILVPVLRDKDYLKASNKPKKVTRAEKIEYMTNLLGKDEVAKLRIQIVQDFGFDGLSVDNELGNILCLRYKKEMNRC